MELASKRCVPCEGGIAPLGFEEIKNYLEQLKNWDLIDKIKIRKSFNFVNFVHAMDFANKVASLAEEEGHHPDLHISYSKCELELWTHAIGGLSENDFILAAKIDRI
jgi:4a-hydroxytetrahydrobiopterin dehydratase